MMWEICAGSMSPLQLLRPRITRHISMRPRELLLNIISELPAPRTVNVGRASPFQA
jgi:hypothetical protein